MPDQEGYPTTDELSIISNFKGDIVEFLNFIQSLWWTNEQGCRFKLTDDEIKIELHTWGWSGNEEIIGVLQSTMFWYFCWQKSTRGGHYWFTVNLKSCNDINFRIRVACASPT